MVRRLAAVGSPAGALPRALPGTSEPAATAVSAAMASLPRTVRVAPMGRDLRSVQRERRHAWAGTATRPPWLLAWPRRLDRPGRSPLALPDQLRRGPRVRGA